ncbi:MAG: MarR family winged helix-turn-helix transcriptional regulator [Anaerolineae bacterium]
MVATAGPAISDAVAELQETLLHLIWHEKLRFSRELANHQLTIPQFFTLVAIKRIGQTCTMGQIAETTNQVSATVTGIIDRLVVRGWVRRRRASDDRRTVLVELTREGQILLEQIQQAKRAHLQGVFMHFAPEEREQILRMLRRYLSTVQAEA